MDAVRTRREFLLGRVAASRPVAVVLEGCLEQRGIVCQACRDACGEGAVRIAPAAVGISMPIIDALRCTGWGECLAVCPASALAIERRP